MLKATPKTTTRIVWAGMYGGHYDQIVFFSDQPSMESSLHSETFPLGYVDCVDNPLLIGDMSLGAFLAAFNCDLSMYLSDSGRPKATEIIETFQLALTTFFEEDGRMMFHDDWT